ncbi:MAG: hypothetical protein QOI27_1372 [Gaiellaceae bacterium]|jgi:hypothetical protein|nr:hypothetical protein [Gaiellaceae bacterium]MDX6470441.1 hypothetical protein [Gaiellaceae bacterium]MDX6472781.1 hypothetical protein [Gaiellaceae bacterium]
MHAMTGPPDAIPSTDNELLTQILARRNRRLPKLTLALAALLIVALTFVVGAEVQKHYGTSAASAAGPNAAAAAAFGRARAAGGVPGGGFGGAGGAGGFGAAASGTTGTVTLIKGSTLYVTDSSGNTSIVKTSASSSVTKTVKSSVKNILPGSTVTVVGPQAKDGSYTATSISVANGG